jgi:hypothetical protein
MLQLIFAVDRSCPLHFPKMALSRLSWTGYMLPVNLDEVFSALALANASILLKTHR